MENLVVKGSHDVFFVPSVNFDATAGKCELSGESYLEETVEFYEPLLEWLQEYMSSEKKALTFDFRMTYFNTSSSRCILDILNLIKEYEDEGNQVIVNWYYEEEDYDMEEEVEDFMIETDLKINLIPL